MKGTSGVIKCQINNDGSVTLDARGLVGSEAGMVAELEALAKEVGGSLEIERHEKGQHDHSHDRGKTFHRH
jgi:hypothetical protein